MEAVQCRTDCGGALHGSAPRGLEVSAPDTTRAEIREVSTDRVALALISAGALAATWSRPPHPRPDVLLVVWIAGNGRAAAHPVGPGSLVVAAGGDVEFTSQTPVRLIEVVLLAAVVPARLDPPEPLVVAAADRSPAVSAFAGFVLPFVSASGPSHERREPLDRAIVDLALAVLAELAHEPVGGANDLRARAETYIDSHLADAALAPSDVAAAVGVSVRALQLVFQAGATSVARTIRERRLDLAARALREEPGPIRAADLAARFGFGGPDQLTRAFRARFGVPPTTYRAAERGE